MVALLGTNGAGKSTLLRVISGLGLPTRGSVRFRGADITYLDAERRLGLGITQIPGGRAVFRADDRRREPRSCSATPSAATRKAVDDGIDATLRRLPAPRRAAQPARPATLSGGEQQMLGLVEGASSCGRGCCSSTSCRSASRR